MAHAMMELLAAGGETLFGADIAQDKERSTPERVMGAAGSTSGVGTILGAGISRMGLAAGLEGFGAFGAGLSGASSVIGAGALGYELGSALDRRADISGNLAGNREDQWEETLNKDNLSPQNVRGEKGVAFANRQRWSAIDAGVHEQADEATTNAKAANMWAGMY